MRCRLPAIKREASYRRQQGAARRRADPARGGDGARRERPRPPWSVACRKLGSIGKRALCTPFPILSHRLTEASKRDGADRGRRISARDQHLCAAARDLGRFRARRRLAGLCARAGADRRGRRATTSRSPARSRRCAALGHELVPLCWCSAPPSSYVERDAYEKVAGCDCSKTSPAQGPFDGIYLDLHGAMVAEHFEDGEGELLRRIRAAGRRRDPDRHQPRFPHQHDAGDGAARERDDRLPHLSAYRHGGDRRPRRRAARPAAEGAAAALQGLPPDRFPDPAGLAMHARPSRPRASST